jgi:ketosteroid isomerase-like protein
MLAARPEARVYPPARPAAPPRPRRPGRVALAFLLVALGTISVLGVPYYTGPMAERVRSPLHIWLKPSGYIGQSAGLLALALFVFLWLYPLRKKFRWLAFTGAMSRWLDVHVLAALALPLLVAVHAAWRFTGVIGLGFWAMMVVWLSGIVGRYIYARIPRGKAGVELTMEEIAGRRKALLEQIARHSGLDLATVDATLAPDGEPRTPGHHGILGTLTRMVADDFARRASGRRLRRLWESRGPKRRTADRRAIRAVLRLARQEMALVQQVRMLDATHAVFRYWHVFHRPVAVAALAAVLVHVAVVIALGATWLW